MVSLSLPGSESGELDWLAFEQSGVLTSAQAAGAVGRSTVRSRIEAGTWRSVCRGIVVTQNGRLDRDQQQWVAVLAAGRDALLAGAAAAAAGGVRRLRVEPLRVLVPAERNATGRLPRMALDMPSVRVHRTAVLPESHQQVGRPRRTTVARSVVDAAAWARTDDEARIVLAAACQQRLVLPEEVDDVIGVLPRIRRRELIRTTMTDIAGGAQALSEIDFVGLCRRYHLPPPDLQERRRDAEGRNRYLDAYWREWRLHVEVDGGHHMDVRHWAADMRRQNTVWIAGDRILRFPAWLIRTQPADVANQLRTALIAAGWQ